MSLQERADYAPLEAPGLGAWIQSVEEDSPAWDAGLEPGMRIDSVNGQPLTDLIAWRWEADGDVCELTVFTPEDGETCSCTLEREPGEDWGIDFTDVLFDGVRTCVNACQFCFMAMLPEGSRSTLMLRDDDYRLSFLQGNFVTLTNVTDEDVERIIRCRLEPMNVSLHAVSPEVRRPLIGRHHQRGIDVLEELLDAGIEIHGQIVLCPGVNDGQELQKTLAWVEERTGITSLALVPLGYTKYSKRFSSSYSDDPELAKAVLATIKPFQERAREAGLGTRFQLSDEFYVAAGEEVPPAEDYDGYPQYYDGIGMLRSFLDEASCVLTARGHDLECVRETLAREGASALVLCGEAAEKTIASFLEAWSPEGRIKIRAIRNDYFGGDVNVTGLIVAEDILAQLPADLSDTVVVLPEIMFNFDKVTLDGVTLADLSAQLEARGGRIVVTQTSPECLVDAMLKL